MLLAIVVAVIATRTWCASIAPAFLHDGADAYRPPGVTPGMPALIAVKIACVTLRRASDSELR